MESEPGKNQSIRALEATGFFRADVQTGLGLFLAAYLAGAGWGPGRVDIMCSASAIGRFSNLHGRKPLLTPGFGVLPVRAALYALTNHAAT